ncbi:hypothetical protein pb186bvf_012615 [Paramecium bursaria]
MNELVEQQQNEINILKSQILEMLKQNQDLSNIIEDQNLQYQKLEYQSQEEIYNLKRELHFCQEQIKHLNKIKGPSEQQQIAFLLKELSESRQENLTLREKINSVQAIHTQIRRFSPPPILKNHNQVQQIQEHKRIPSLPDSTSNRQSIQRPPMPNPVSFHGYQRPKVSPIKNKISHSQKF